MTGLAYTTRKTCRGDFMSCIEVNSFQGVFGCQREMVVNNNIPIPFIRNP
mgnify:CR=1 FL=1